MDAANDNDKNQLSKLAILPASVFDLCPDKPHNQHKTLDDGKGIQSKGGMQGNDKSFSFPISTCMSGGNKAKVTSTTTSPTSWIGAEILVPDGQTNDDATVMSAARKQRKVRFLIPPESAITNTSRKRRKFKRRNSPRGLVRCMKFYSELESMNNNGKKSARPQRRSVVLNIVNDNDDDDDDCEENDIDDTVVSSETMSTTSH